MNKWRYGITIVIAFFYAQILLPQKENILKRQYKSFMDDARLVTRCLKKSSKCSADERAQAPYAAMRVIGKGAVIAGILLGGGYVLYKSPLLLPKKRVSPQKPLSEEEFQKFIPAIKQKVAKLAYMPLDKIKVGKDDKTGKYGIYIPIVMSAIFPDGQKIMNTIHAEYPSVVFLIMGPDIKEAAYFVPKK